MQMRLHLIRFRAFKRTATRRKRTLRLSLLFAHRGKTALHQMCVHFERRQYDGASDFGMRTMTAYLFDFSSREIIRKEIGSGERLVVNRTAGIRFPGGFGNYYITLNTSKYFTLTRQ